MKNIPLEERIILALDVEKSSQAKELVKRTESHIRFYKVGLQLFVGSCFEVVDWIVERGHKVMLDLKFFDIPATVNLAVKQLNNRGITFTTIHGNDAIIKAAVEAKADLALLAVTVLTSFGVDDMAAMGISHSVEEVVCRRAQNALELGCEGVVASGLEAKSLRERFGPGLLIVTPGIRLEAPGKNARDDQQRTVTAGQAITAGADYLVVGRPITKADDPVAAVERMQQEIIRVQKF